MLLRRHPGVVHDPHVDDRLHVMDAEDVLRLLLSEVDLEELHVLGRPGERPAVETDDAVVTVQLLDERAPQVPAEPRDHHHLS
jgi:hypothetical protein